MSALDREKAREVLMHYVAAQWHPEVLDALAGCVTDDPQPFEGYCVCDDGRPAKDCGVSAHRRAAGVSDEPPTIDRDALSTAVGRVLFNASNYPQAVQTRMLGQDTSMLRGLIVNAVLALLRPDPRIAKLEAWVEDVDDGGFVFIHRVRAILRGEA